MSLTGLRRPILRNAFAVVAILALGAPAMGAALSAALERVAPEQATAAYGGNASALTRQAAMLVAQGPKASAEDLASARRLVDRAFASTLLNPAAYRVAGFTVSPTLQGDEVRPWIQAAASVSHRDSGSYIWLAQDTARHGDLGKTLDYVDYALRSSFSASDTLMPLLVTGLVDPLVQQRIPELVHKDVFWTGRFLDDAASTSQRPDIVADVVIASGGFPNRPKENESVLIRRLVAMGYYDQALKFASFVDKGVRGAAGTVAVSEATIGERFAPISWQINADVASVVALEDQRLGIVARVDRDRTSLIAGKLVYAVPSGARFTGSVRFAKQGSSDRLQIEAACAKATGTRFVPVGTPVIATTTAAQPFTATLAFDCSPIEVRLWSSSTLDGSGNELTLSDLAIMR